MDQADVVEMEDTCSINVLPREIWSQVFTFLTLADRKAVRLTCRSWYDSSTSGNITKHEKFVFRTHPGYEHIDAIMLRSNYSFLNLEFQWMLLRVLPANVWKSSGMRIRELEFHSCVCDDETIGNIILHCENLTSLVITQPAGVRGLNPIAYTSRLLNDFTEKGIRRPKLHTLSIFINYDEHESVLRKIFLLHPCIKHLTFTLMSDESILDPFTLRLDKCLNPDTQLESLTPILRTPEGLIGILVDQTQRGLRLKHLELSRRCDRMISLSVEDKIFNFFKSQRNLEVLKFMSPIADKELVYNILESCPKLRELRLNSERSMTLKRSEVSRFIASISKLKFLELGVELAEDSEQVPSSFSDALPNTVQLNLTALYWRCATGGSDFLDAFLQRCSSLKHLRLARCCDTTLQIIFQHLSELQTLVSDDTSHCTNFGFFGLTEDGNEAGYSIKRLQRLKHLKLLRSYPIILTERTALELQLPHLEYLSLHVGWYEKLSEEALNHFASCLSKLHVLTIYHDFRFDVEETIRLCKHLNNLHHLIFFVYFVPDGDHVSVPRTEIQKIISACPSLRYISNSSYFADDVTYKRDPFTGKLRFKESLKFPRNIFEI